MKKNFIVAGVVMVPMMFVVSCASSSRPAGHQEVLMRSTLTATPEEVARIRAADQKSHDDLDAIAGANARVLAFDKVRMDAARKDAERVRSMQEANAAKRRAYREQQIAERRARITAEQKDLLPQYEALVEEENRKRQEAAGVKLRRGIK